METLFDLNIIIIMSLLILMTTIIHNRNTKRKKDLIENFNTQLLNKDIIKGKDNENKFNTQILNGFELVKEITKDIFKQKDNNTITIDKSSIDVDDIKVDEATLDENDFNNLTIDKLKSKKLKVNNKLTTKTMEIEDSITIKNMDIKHSFDDKKKILSLSVVGGFLYSPDRSVPMFEGKHRVSNGQKRRNLENFFNNKRPYGLLLYPKFKVVITDMSDNNQIVIENKTNNIKNYTGLENHYHTGYYSLESLIR